MLLCSWRKSRRTLAMVSTINIPGWLPKPSPGGSMEERCREWVPLGRRSARQPGPSSTPILNPVRIATEGAVWGSIKAHGLLPDTVIRKRYLMGTLRASRRGRGCGTRGMETGPASVWTAKPEHILEKVGRGRQASDALG